MLNPPPADAIGSGSAGAEHTSTERAKSSESSLEADSNVPFPSPPPADWEPQYVKQCRKMTAMGSNASYNMLLRLIEGRCNLAFIAEGISGRGAHVMSCGLDGTSLIHYGAIQDDRKLVEYLLDQGADINAWSLGTPAPLHIASLLGHTKLVKLLLGRGADVNRGSWAYPPGRAGGPGAYRDSGYEQLVTRLNADNKAVYNPEYVSSYWTPLHWAVIGGKVEVVKMLLESGAKVNPPGGRTTCAWTPLHLACLWRWPEVANFSSIAARTSAACAATTTSRH